MHSLTQQIVIILFRASCQNSCSTFVDEKITHLPSCSPWSEADILNILLEPHCCVQVPWKRNMWNYNQEHWDCMYCITCLMYAGAGSEHLSKESFLWMLYAKAISEKRLKTTGLMGGMKVHYNVLSPHTSYWTVHIRLSMEEVCPGLYAQWVKASERRWYVSWPSEKVRGLAKWEGD